MTIIDEDRPSLLATSPISILVVSGAMAVQSTAASNAPQYLQTIYEWSAHSTSSGSVQVQSTESTRRALAELRRISGLTWEQLAQMFGVNRRSIHFWASGKPLSAQHEAHLRRALDIVRNSDRGSAAMNRAALLQPSEDGTPLDLLAEERFVPAERALGRRASTRRAPKAELSEDARARRRPLPPDQLVGAEQGAVHREPSERRRPKGTKRRG